MLYGGMRESREREVSLPKFNSRTWRAVLEYVYFEDVDVDSLEFGLELYECARFCELACQEDAVLRVLGSLLDSSNCSILLAEVEKNGFRKLKADALKIIADNFIDLSKSNAFALLSIDLMEQVLGSGK